MSYTSKYTGPEIDNLLDSIGSINVTKTVLWEGDLHTMGECATLSQSLEEFDYLVLSVYHRINASADSVRVVPDTFINVNEIKSRGYGNNNSLLYQTFLYADVSVGTSRQSNYTFPSATEICYSSGVNIGTQSSKTSFHLTKVVGIKLSSGTSGASSSNPIGAIIPIMGTTAPKDHLICDGSELNINEYKELADYFEAQFGTKNHFGGDGINTFAVPDLRNEFLRGYHGDADKQLSGEIGEHQDGTISPWMKTGTDAALWCTYPNEITHYEEQIGTRTGTISIVGSKQSASVTYANYTSRPTNVAVLFCIKYTEASAGASTRSEENYSTDEQRIGTWIDGKPIYQKTITGYKTPATADGTSSKLAIDVADLCIDTAVETKGLMLSTVGGYYSTPVFYGGKYYGVQVYYAKEANTIVVNNSCKAYGGLDCYITIKYTKTTD